MGPCFFSSDLLLPGARFNSSTLSPAFPSFVIPVYISVHEKDSAIQSLLPRKTDTPKERFCVSWQFCGSKENLFVTPVHLLFLKRNSQCFFIEFIGVTLFSKSIWVSSGQFYDIDAWSVPCLVWPPPGVKSSSFSFPLLICLSRISIRLILSWPPSLGHEFFLPPSLASWHVSVMTYP